MQTTEPNKPAGAQSFLTDGLAAAADRVIESLQNMTGEQIVEALESVEDDSISRAICGC